ncbi:sensor histidine kinase [Haloechinothrix halophila]|uniref:sensor histidine kinase n=1 Tax=Haloechinothrix halophila TaxID=1069073 RepID=UPI0003FF041D|nr:sensor histidine kinase [Haloechinothrix halophila]
MLRTFQGAGSRTIKAKVLAIALIPSIALLIVGAAVSGYLINKGLHAKEFAEDVRGSLKPTARFVAELQEERRLSVLLLTTGKVDVGDLQRQRREVDVALDDVYSAGERLAASGPGSVRAAFNDLATEARALPSMRDQINTRDTTPLEAYEFYGELVERVGAGIQGVAQSASDAEVAFEQMISYDLFRSVEAQSRSHVLVGLAMSRGLSSSVYHELAHQMGTYHEIINLIESRLTPAEQEQYAALQETDAWATLTGGDNDIMAKGPGKHEPSFDVAEWENAASTLSEALLRLYIAHSSHAADIGAASGNATLLTSALAGAGILAAALAAMVIALRLSRGLIERLTRLREETLDLSNRELPGIVERLRQGDRVDVEYQIPWLDFGVDEIGQVASAFNKAQQTAISAAVQESETRRGVGSVFLNIAHRTQVIVHRQLKVLDSVERSEDDPDQLQLLFQLDHLATRSRRNAENLIILGGEQPGRQWRNPVSLREVVRSAVSETEHYTRVGSVSIPDTLMDGKVVADLAHLLAELIDNATAFSPPQSKVEVRGNAVGRGVVIEVEDQGLGMEKEQLDKFNTMLRKPPDFSVMALSTESRVGLFVVARLASRHGIKITLRESIYGGTTAIVLVPTDLIAQETTPHEPPMVSGTGMPDDGAGDGQEPRHEGTLPNPDNGLPTVTDLPPIGSSWRTVVFDKPESQEAPPAQPAQSEKSAPPGRPASSTGAGATGARQPGGKPPLPQRKRQANLAPQLADGGQEADAPDPADDLMDAERTRSVMAALQQGNLRGRTTEVSLNGHN